MTPESVIVQRGEFVENFMRSETFNAIYREYTDAALQRLLNSQPHETKLREFEYTKITAISEFVNHLASLAEAGAVIKAQSNSQSDED
jgi:hypothetical protein